MPEPLLLDRLLLVSHLFQQDMAREYAGTALSEARVAVLWTIHHAGPVTQQAIASALGLTPRTISAHVDALEASGHVERTAHPDDRRAHLVALTPMGGALMDRTVASHADLSAQLLAAVAPADRAALERGLDAVAAALTELIAAHAAAHPAAAEPR
jgi:DNA-binding MarR family transcriptional regulator